MSAPTTAGRFQRLIQIIGHLKVHPPVQGLIPVSRSRWWQSVRSDRYPRSFKRSSAVTVGSVENLHADIDSVTGGDQ